MNNVGSCSSRSLPCCSPRPRFQVLISFATMMFMMFFSALAVSAQDTPRFEVGGSLSTLNDGGKTNVGPGFTGVWNIGRFVSLEGALNWFPEEEAFTSFKGPHFFDSVRTTTSALEVLTGVKAGYRNDKFGVFGKFRPGFISAGNTLLQTTTVLDSFGFSLTSTQRFGRLTERALDVGGVFEYYPSRRWAVRFDAGDTLIRREVAPNILIAPPGGPTFNSTAFFYHTAGHFQMNTGVQYRF